MRRLTTHEAQIDEAVKMRIIFVCLAVVMLITSVSSMFSTAARHGVLRQGPDPISGDWDVSFTLQGTTVTGMFKLKLDGERVTGTAESAHTGPGTLSKGS